jgi:hypothetical protein
MAAGLKVWRASQWMGALVMGSVKREALFGVMTGALVGRVKGPSCQMFVFGAVEAKSEMARVAVAAGREVRIRMWMQVCHRSGMVGSCERIIVGR